jgi:poly-gamma-glutamate capsule biosynthesis protein CapA/YwtB (metallophosphatase superfamily)
LQDTTDSIEWHENCGSLNVTPHRSADALSLFLCGDIMTGRGVDQVLPHPSRPNLYEPYVESALEYVTMAENANGSIPKPVGFSYIWGDAAQELDRVAPAARIINLETSVTTSEDHEPKGINYRMNPANTPCLTAAKIDCCALANNHVLDWGRSGLAETLATLHRAGLKTAGAGRNLSEAADPAILQVAGNARVLVFAAGAVDSGISRDWAATPTRPGVALLPDLSVRTADQIAERVSALKRPGDIAVLSIHWGGNWGYQISREHREFARKLIDTGTVDIIHGHSSHHPKGIEVYRSKPILYGCGDFLNDYEGISGYEQFRSHLVLMYFVTMHRATGNLLRLEMTPLEIHRFRLRRAGHQDATWLGETLDREAKRLGAQVILSANDHLILQWKETP